MAEDKAKALKEAPYNIKIYYSGNTPANCGVAKLMVEEVSFPGGLPWLVKAYNRDGKCMRQFVEADATYRVLFREISTILDVAVVNNKQREALTIMLDKVLYQNLKNDQANEGDYIV